MSEKKKILYFDCSSGISGDMIVASLLDLGADRNVLMNALASLPEDSGFHIKISRVKKSSIDCCDFDVILDELHENHDHDIAYLYSMEQAENPAFAVHTHSSAPDHVHTDIHDSTRVHIHTDIHDSTHDHVHSHSGTHEHAHVHRSLSDIEQILADCDLSDRALELAGRIFAILAESEAKAHGVPVAEVHFHEVGAIDSIVDIISIAVCMDNLDVDDVVISKLAEGTGMVRTQHGFLPVPVPAVLNIVQAYGLSLAILPIRGEYVTPTGAAFCAAVKSLDRLPEKFRVIGSGLGAGKREQELPGILRALLLEQDETADVSEKIDVRAEEKRISQVKDQLGNGYEPDLIWKLETQMDDCSGEILGYVMDLLLYAGARDVYYSPVFMKKNRPGWLLTVICTEEMLEAVEDIIFTETSTIGIRKTQMERDTLPRVLSVVETKFGDVAVKKVRIGEREKIYPEFESARKTATAYGVSLQEVYDEIKRAAGK